MNNLFSGISTYTSLAHRHHCNSNKHQRATQIFEAIHGISHVRFWSYALFRLLWWDIYCIEPHFAGRKNCPPSPRYLPAALDAWKIVKKCGKCGVSWLDKPYVPIQQSSTQVGYLHHALASLKVPQIPCLKPNFLCWNTSFCCLACHGDGLEVAST